MCLGCRGEVEPFRLGFLRTGGQHLHLVTTGQGMTQRNQAMVHFGSNAMVTNVRVQGVSKIQGCRPLRKRLDVSLGGEDKDLGTEQIQFDGVQEI